MGAVGGIMKVVTNIGGGGGDAIWLYERIRLTNVTLSGKNILRSPPPPLSGK